MDQQLENTFLKALEQNQHKLLRICSLYAEDADDKKDLFQEVLINIWQSMPSFEGKSSISTWMFRITLNVCLRLKTKMARKKEQFRKLDSIIIENVANEEPSQQNQEQLGVWLFPSISHLKLTVRGICLLSKGMEFRSVYLRRSTCENKGLPLMKKQIVNSTPIAA